MASIFIGHLCARPGISFLPLVGTELEACSRPVHYAIVNAGRSTQTVPADIVIMAHEDDRGWLHSATQLCRDMGLASKSCPPALPDAPRRMLVVFLSRAALSDEAFTALAESAAEAPYPTLPVTVEEVAADALPPALATHNWLNLSGKQESVALGDLRHALLADPASHLFFEDIKVSADRWHRTGGLEDTLLSDRRQVDAALDRLALA